jgi:hypothetical protein
MDVLKVINEEAFELLLGGDQPLTKRREFFVAFSEAPQVALQLAARTRRVKILESVYKLLNQQYYQAKIEEAKDTPTVQVLDVAHPPEHKCCPNRSLIGVTGGFLAFWVLVLWLWLEKYFQDLKIQNPEEYAHWEKLKRTIQRKRTNK